MFQGHVRGRCWLLLFIRGWGVSGVREGTLLAAVVHMRVGCFRGV